MKRVWLCDTCLGCHPSQPWPCAGCEKEVCENCFDKYAHCKSCTKNKTDEELILQANTVWGYDFEAPTVVG